MVEQRAFSSVLLVVYQLAQIHELRSHLSAEVYFWVNSKSKLVRLVIALFCESQMLTFSSCHCAVPKHILIFRGSTN